MAVTYHKHHGHDIELHLDLTPEEKIRVIEKVIQYIPAVDRKILLSHAKVPNRTKIQAAFGPEHRWARDINGQYGRLPNPKYSLELQHDAAVGIAKTMTIEDLFFTRLKDNPNVAHKIMSYLSAAKVTTTAYIKSTKIIELHWPNTNNKQTSVIHDNLEIDELADI